MSSLSLSAQRSIIETLEHHEDEAHIHTNLPLDQWSAYSLHHTIPYHEG